jgi:hypothetical protein
MYALVQESGHAVWREHWYAYMSRVSLRADLYMTRKDQVFVVDMVVIDSTREMMASSVIIQPTSVIAELRAITKMHK